MTQITLSSGSISRSVARYEPNCADLVSSNAATLHLYTWLLLVNTSSSCVLADGNSMKGSSPSLYLSSAALRRTRSVIFLR
ncbi:Uncharacterised protein [Collinsella intestinalis]|nr:Uncharacterised protein [Collinsella intestinalis]